MLENGKGTILLSDYLQEKDQADIQWNAPRVFGHPKDEFN